MLCWQWCWWLVLSFEAPAMAVMEFRPWQWCWWLVLSFEAPAMEIVGLIQRWKDRVRREEREGEMLEAF